MDAQKLRPLLESVKKNPEDHWMWLQLGYVAKLMEDWNTSYCAYLTAVSLCPNDEESYKKFLDVRENYLKSVPPVADAFKMEVLRLPRQQCVLLLRGLLNTDIEKLESTTKDLIKKGFKKIILDCQELTHVTGLGPSTLRNLYELATSEDCKLIMAHTNADILNVFRLKGFEIPQSPDLPSALRT